MRHCAIRGCENNDQNPDLRFFIFPTDLSRRRVWEELSDERALVKRFVCSEHFDDDAFRLQDVLLNVPVKNRKLVPNARPVLKIPFLRETTVTKKEQRERIKERKCLVDDAIKDYEMFLADEPELEEPSDLNCCRLCMQTRGIENDLFESRENAEPLATILERYFGIQLQEEERWPSKACHGCTTTIDAFVEMKETIIATQRELELRSVKVELLDGEDLLPEEPDATVDSLIESEEDTPLSASVEATRKIIWTEEERKAIDNEMNQRDLLICSVCQEGGWNTYQDLRNHTRTAHNERTIITCCGLKFRETVAMEHMQFHMDADIYKCTTCDRNFSTRNSLKRHRNYVHLNPKLAKHCCETCGKFFSYKHVYEKHLKTHLPATARDFICEVCGLTFATNAQRETHRRCRHEERRSVACPLCAVHVFDLQMHMRMNHAGREIKLISCNLCGKQVKERYYKMHIRQTHSDPSHVCNLCGKAFRIKQKLEAHMNLHQGIRLPCRFCDHTATHSGSLSIHMAKKHPLEYEEYKIQRRRTPLVKNTEEG